MRNHIYYLAVVLTSLIVSSCYKDKGNYVYEELSSVVIDLGVGGYYGPRSTDTLNIDPTLIINDDTLKGSQVADRFEFTWYSNDTEIANTPVLFFPVRDLIGQRPFVKLRLVNKADQSTSLAGFYVDAIPEYQNGWIVLSKKDNRSIVSFINPENYLVTADFYTNIAEQELGPNAIEVKEHWMAGGNLTGTGNVLIIRNDPDGNIELNGTDLSPMYKTNNFFLGNVKPVDFRPKGEFYMWDYSMMLDDNGNIYTRKHENSAFSQSGVYPNKPMHIPGGVKFHQGWAGTFLSGQVILYDKDNGKLFLGTDRGFVLPVNFMPGPPIPPGTTLIHAMDKELVYVGPLKQGRFVSSYFMVYRDAAGNHRIQKLQIMDNFYTVMAIMMWETSFAQEQANTESVFAQFPRIENYMFYSGGADNKTLYLYQTGPRMNSVYHTFDSKIKTISVNQENIMGLETHSQIMVGLENGDVYILGALAEHINNPGSRLIKKIELDQGVPVSTMYKIGFGYRQM